MTDLLPCPFCGRQPEVFEHDIEDEGVWTPFEITCEHGWDRPYKGGKDHERCWDFSVSGDCLDDLIEEWNTRYVQVCQNTLREKTLFSCSNCGCEISKNCDISAPIGEYGKYESGLLPRYCPVCGARVISD